MERDTWALTGLVVATVMCAVMLQGVIVSLVEGQNLGEQGGLLALWLGLVGLTIAGWAGRGGEKAKSSE